MACGTGKSYVAAWAVQAAKAKSVLVLVPSLSLVRQLKESFDQVKVPGSIIAVCSDKTVAGSDAVYVSSEEVGCTVTTDPAVVRAHLKQRGSRIVFCTYQSAPLLQGLKFDFGVFDEAHKTAGRGDKSFGFALYDENVTITKRLFLTATPRVVRFPVDKEDTEEVVSMDDPQVYGPKFFSLSFRKAVEKKIITGYRLIISTVKESVEVYNHPALQVALQSAMTERGIKKVFAFFRTVSEAQAFGKDRSGLDPDVQVLHVNGGMSTAERKGVITQFEKAPRAILTNARCLTEGVDVPVVDMVVFAQAKRSTIDIVQAAGRAMRNSPGKNLGYIFLPVWRDDAKGETFEDATMREGFKPLHDTLRALAEQDALLEDVLENIRTGKGSTDGGGGGVGMGEGGIIEYDDPVDVEALRRAVEHAIVEHRRPDGYWTESRIRSAAAGCASRSEFIRKFSAAYLAAVSLGIYEELIPSKSPRWDVSELFRLAKRFSSKGRSALKKYDYGAYQAIIASKHRDEILAHIPLKVKTAARKKWTNDKLLAEARKFEMAVDFRRANYAAYVACYKRDLLWTVFTKRNKRSA